MGARVLLLAGLAGLAGCANNRPSKIEDWWHESIGGKINEQRPPSPGNDDPYPNLATVPPRPPPTDTAGWNRTTAQLMNDRIAARQAAAVTPIPTAPAPAPAPSATPPAADQGASAALVGAPPPAASAPPPRPVARPAAAAPPIGMNPPPRPPAPMTSAEAAQRVANGKLPPLPSAAPARPNVAPTPPPPPVPLTAAPPVAAPPPPGQQLVDFDRESARVNDPALASAQLLAATRGERGIAITGHGDATSSDPLDQVKAVNLGLARAQALATALVAMGVPHGVLRLNAESAGRGASLRLLQ